VLARSPRAFRRRHLARAIELGGVLAEVPDVSVPVLRVVIERPFLKLPVQVQAITDDPTRNAVDALRAAQDDELVAGRLPVFRSAVTEGRSRSEREPGVG